MPGPSIRSCGPEQRFWTTAPSVSPARTFWKPGSATACAEGFRLRSLLVAEIPDLEIDLAGGELHDGVFAGRERLGQPDLVEPVAHLALIGFEQLLLLHHFLGDGHDGDLLHDAVSLARSELEEGKPLRLRRAEIELGSSAVDHKR